MSQEQSTASVVHRWFSAHAAGDLDAARRLMTPDAPIRVAGQQLTGFDGLTRWYADRAAALGPTFRYDVVDVLSGERHAGAVLALSDATRSWQQVAVYRVEGGLITGVTAYEDDPH